VVAGVDRLRGCRIVPSAIKWTPSGARWWRGAVRSRLRSAVVAQGLKAVPKGPPVVRITTFGLVRGAFACPIARARSSSPSNRAATPSVQRAMNRSGDPTAWSRRRTSGTVMLLGASARPLLRVVARGADQSNDAAARALGPIPNSPASASVLRSWASAAAASPGPPRSIKTRATSIPL
jgi:hypothetical protein